MKLSYAAAGIILASATVSASPIHFLRGFEGDFFSTPRDSKGAAYLITNGPEDNFVVSLNIGSEGKLSFGHVTWAGGRGAHGQSNPPTNVTNPDPVFSQGVIKTKGRYLATVNPGSNTVVLLESDKREPAKLSIIGRPVNSGGEFPVSVAFSKTGKVLCVANGGLKNGVHCFDVDSKRGLVPKANTQRSLNLNQTTPATGPAGTVSHIIFSEDGTQLLVSVKGIPPTPGFIASWTVNNVTGALSDNFVKSIPAAGGLLPFSMTVIPGKNAVLTTDAGVGFDIFDFKNGQNASSTVVPISGQKATCWSSLSKKTGNFYLTDVATATVTEVHVDNQLKGSIVKQYPQGNGSIILDNDVATINNKDFLYILAAGTTSVTVLSLRGPGQATSVQDFNFSANAKEAGVNVDPNNLQGMTVFAK